MVFSAVRGGMRPEEVKLIERFTGQGRVRDRNPPKGWQAQLSWGIDFGSISGDREAHNLGKLSEKARIHESHKATICKKL